MTDRATKQYETMQAHFRRAAEQRGFAVDPAQRPAVERLSQLAGELARVGLFNRHPPRHVYLWGPVGRGKSWLVDTFLDGLATPRARRLHFHDFFRRLHEGVALHTADPHREAAGERVAAVDRAVDELLGDCRVLVFDEFHAHDAGDAMLVARLFRTLLDRRITLVTTSNYPPAGLMPNPLYHHLFEPTIRLIEERMDVVEIAGPVDFRRERRSSAEGGRQRFTQGARLRTGDESGLRALGLSAPTAAEAAEVVVHGRPLRAAAVRDGEAWFGFAELCEGLTSAADQLALAERFPTLVLTGVPALEDATADGRRRFADLVDVCCDRDVRLVLIGADPISGPAPDESLVRDLDRTASRLALLRST
ncbi:cell division protein ZapE [Kitasatospora sp. CM 4170]|uniref:Cell division protein ZapE n=1 Tax=Kitasatospora aburaviensis TaxID=67265 RepID=A0ABW1EWD8_9ACTN|nr:cell division protein ZapE [Kitasatospora sp. CM 4170]WNM43961.1 cell division protein ZapE [Kitasatospora sp. CM 4170]